MIRLADPDEVEAEYLRQLNLCFPGWGGRETFDWCFRRRAGGPAADLLVACEGSRLIAGSAITYRRVRRRGACEAAAIMTGSWTAPAARGRGLFKQMIAASRTRAAERGCGLLLGFGRAANPSARALAAAGFHQLAAAYCEASPALPSRELEPATIDEAETAFRSRQAPAGAWHFDYTEQEWHGQFVALPNPVSALRLGQGLVALVEHGPAANRLLDVSTRDSTAWADAATAAAGAVHPLSAYTIEPRSAERLARSGFSLSPGVVHILTLGGAEVSNETCWVSNGDRM